MRKLAPRKYLIILICCIIGWFLLGSPKKTILNLIWPKGPSPWEMVHAFYYPDKSNLYDVLDAGPFLSLTECRDWVSKMATLKGDPNVLQGDYECGVGELPYAGPVPIRIFRLTVR